MSGAEAGYAVSQVGFINAGQPSLILVGSPGYTFQVSPMPGPRT